jgi:hypothetical protein
MAKNYNDKKAGEHWHTTAVLYELDEKVYSTVRIKQKNCTDQLENSPKNRMPIMKKDYISIEHGLAYKCEEIVSGDE